MNMQQMVQAMQKAQKQYEKDHKVLEETEFEFTANGAVKVRMKGSLELLAVEFLDKDILSDDPEMVADMIKIAYNGCKAQIDEAEAELSNRFQAKAGVMGGMM